MVDSRFEHTERNNNPTAAQPENSEDNLLPARNKNIGIIGKNPIKTATDAKGSTRLREAGKPAVEAPEMRLAHS